MIGVTGALGTVGNSYAASLEKELAGLLLDHPNIRAAEKGVEALRQEVKRIEPETLLVAPGLDRQRLTQSE